MAAFEPLPVLKIQQKLGRLHEPKIDRVVAELPNYRCFCCHDSGLVRSPELVIQDYDHCIDPPVLCRNCNAAAHTLGEEAIQRLDGRVTAEDCRQIHDWDYTGWLVTLRNSRPQPKPKPTPKPMTIGAHINRAV